MLQGNEAGFQFIQGHEIPTYPAQNHLKTNIKPLKKKKKNPLSYTVIKCVLYYFIVAEKHVYYL